MLERAWLDGDRVIAGTPQAVTSQCSQAMDSHWDSECHRWWFGSLSAVVVGNRGGWGFLKECRSASADTEEPHISEIWRRAPESH